MEERAAHRHRILGESGLVHGDRRGRFVWYSLDANDSPPSAKPSIPEGTTRPEASVAMLPLPNEMKGVSSEIHVRPTPSAESGVIPPSPKENQTK
jgi:hypothetical protein